MPVVLNWDAATFHLEPVEGEGKIKCYEMANQPYTNASFSAGLVVGAEPDTVYLRHDKGGEEPLIVLLRPDEMQAIVWVCGGTLWSHAHEEMLEEEDDDAQVTK